MYYLDPVVQYSAAPTHIPPAGKNLNLNIFLQLIIIFLYEELYPVVPLHKPFTSKSYFMNSNAYIKLEIYLCKYSDFILLFWKAVIDRLFSNIPSIYS